MRCWIWAAVPALCRCLSPGLGMAVTAADPEPDMLAAAEAAARAAGVALTLWRGGSYDLTPAWDPIRLVTHRARLSLDGPSGDPGDAGPDHRAGRRGGSVSRRPSACCRKMPGSRPCARWATDMAAPPSRTSPSARRSAIAAMSRFSISRPSPSWTGFSVTIRKPISVDEIVGRAFSQSTILAGKAGRRARDAFEAELARQTARAFAGRRIHRNRRDGGVGGAT